MENSAGEKEAAKAKEGGAAEDDAPPEEEEVHDTDEEEDMEFDDYYQVRVCMRIVEQNNVCCSMQRTHMHAADTHACSGHTCMQRTGLHAAHTCMRRTHACVTNMHAAHASSVLY